MQFRLSMTTCHMSHLNGNCMQSSKKYISFSNTWLNILSTTLEDSSLVLGENLGHSSDWVTMVTTGTRSLGTIIVTKWWFILSIDTQVDLLLCHHCFKCWDIALQSTLSVSSPLTSMVRSPILHFNWNFLHSLFACFTERHTLEHCNTSIHSWTWIYRGIHQHA